MKLEEVSTIKNTYFTALPDKAKLRIAGVIKSIDDKETPSGTAKRFKGDIAVSDGVTIYQARYCFFSTQLRDAIMTTLSKVGKWESFEFVMAANKSVTDKGGNWSITFEVSPRVEMPRVLALLEE